MGQTTLYAVDTDHDKKNGNLLCSRLIAGDIGMAFIAFMHDTTLYQDKSLTKKAYEIQKRTCAKIASVSANTADGIILGVTVGSNIAYMRYAYYKINVGSANAAYFHSTQSNKIGWLGNKLGPPKAISSSSSYLSGVTAIKYENLNPGGTLDESRLCPNGKYVNDTTKLDETQEAMANDAVNSTLNAANNTGADTSDGDLDTTDNLALKLAPTFFYNIGQHLARFRQLLFDDEGNVVVDKDGNVVYKTDANGNYVMTGPADAIEAYKTSTAINGINYKNLRNIFGAPYQFLPTTDCRIIPGDNNGSGSTSARFSENLELAGYEFTEKILSRMPLLFITPGNTSFMGGSSENARTALIGQLDEAYVDKDISENSLRAMLEDYNGKLYTIMPAYAEYFNYVNPMCRAGAIFLGLAGNVDDTKNKRLNGKTLDVFHWGIYKGQDYTPYIEEEDTILGDQAAEDAEQAETPEETTDGTKPEEDIKSKYNWEERDNVFEEPEEGSFKDFQQAMYYGNAIPFYINSEASFQDSFSNETTDSTLSSTINALSDRAREIQFLLGTASSAVGEAFDKVDGTLTDVKEQINNIVSKVAGGNSIFTTIANSVKTIVSGGRLLFPQIWSNSQFTKSYNISIKLTTPSYDKFSWWLNIYVPLCHLMALVLPRSEYVNSYTTPFLIKAFYRGMFNIDMGIITEMSFNRGKEGSWTKDGLPTVVDVSFSIQDLYTGMGMTSLGAMFKGTTLQNVSEMDYIANLCGININEPDLFRMVTLWATFNLKDRITDFLPNMSMNIGSSLRNMGLNMYNSLWGL